MEELLKAVRAPRPRHRFKLGAPTNFTTFASLSTTEKSLETDWILSSRIRLISEIIASIAKEADSVR